MALDRRHALLIASREYVENVRTRGFWLSLLLLPVILGVLSIAPVLLSDAASESDYAVIDQSGWLNAQLQRRVLVRDLELLIAAIDESSGVAGVEGLEGLATSAPDLPERTADLILSPEVRGNRASSGDPDSSDAHDRLARWWRADPSRALAIEPRISTGRFRFIETPGADRAALDQMIEDQRLLGFFVIPDDPVSAPEGAAYVTRTLTNFDLPRWFAAHATEIVRDRRIREENLAPELADWISEPVRFQTVHLTDDGAANAEVDDTLSQWAPVVFVYMLWISIFSVTQMLLTNTVEEKSNKLVEVLLSSVSAIDLMTGKILGIAATGLTIVGTWLLIAIAGASILPSLTGASIDILGLATNPLYLASFLIYFVLGYLFYAALLCGLGSLANNLKEAQNLMIPVQLCLFIPLLIMIPIGRDPNGLLAEVMTWLPPFTPFVMMNRAAFPPGVATYLGTTVLMLGSILVALRVAARVFETGILMTGKPPKIRQLIGLIARRVRPVANHQDSPGSGSP